MKYLLCYEIGVLNKLSSFGHGFFTMPELTEEWLDKASKEILERAKKDRPEFEFQSLVWRSVTRLDG